MCIIFTDPPSAEDPSAVPDHWRQYIDDMLDPRKPSPEEPVQKATQPKMNIKARVRATQQRGVQQPYVPPQLGTDSQDRRSSAEHQPTHLHRSNPSTPHQPGPGFRQETPGLDPYNLPSQFNPEARYEQLPPELTKQMFGKYDRKKLVPFDFEDEEYQEPFRNGGPSVDEPGSRAIFWEEIPTDLATTFTESTPCQPGFNCPDVLPEFADPSFPVPDLADPFLQTPNPPVEPPPALVPPDQQRQADRSTLRKPQIKTFKVETKKLSQRKEHKPRRRKHRRKHRKGKSRNKKTKIDKTKQSSASHLEKPITSASNRTSKVDKEQYQKDGKACRGDLCYLPEESEEENVTPYGVVRTDDFGRCPDGFELLIVNDFQVCKPLQELVSSRTFPAASPATATISHHATEETVNNVDSEIAVNSVNELESIKSVLSTRPPFINFCVKEGKIMIITAQGIHCKQKSEENIFVDCEEHEVYVETVAGFICRDPSTEDILSTPIQCPSGHTLIKTNTGYECRGTVVLESSCPENYETVRTMSGTICSPSSPFVATGKTACPPGTVLRESEEDGTKCLPMTDELYAATTVVSDELVTADQPREDPIGLPPEPDVPTSSSVPDLTTAAILCPPGQIGVQTDSGPVCKYYTKLEKGRGDLPVSCPEGQTMMNTESGRLCIGASVMIEYEGPVTHLYSETEESLSTISPCPEGQVLVSTEDGEKCQDLQRPFVLPTDDILLVQNVCPEGQVAVNTSDGSECRWIGLEKETGSEPLCPEGCSIQQTNFGLLCINDTTGQPSVDSNFPCLDGQIALFTPKGTMCKSEGVIVGKILTITEINDLKTEPGCGLHNVVFQTLAGALCLDKLSREPVIHEEKVCPDSELGVLTPSGVVCKLRSDILLYTLNRGSCSIGQTVAATKAGSICVHEDTKYPVIDDSLPCPDGQAPVVTPSGTFCKLRSAIVTALEEIDGSSRCNSGQTVLETAAGSICINSETLLPIIDESISCAEGHVPVVTPAGTFCRHRLSLLTRLSEKLRYACADGQTIVETEAGAICIHGETMEPIIDENAFGCQDGQVAVITPSGTQCKSRLAILTRLVKKTKGYIKTETVPTNSCFEGQKILETEAGAICIHSETLQPVIDETVSCTDGQTPVVTPTGTLCKLRSAILTRLTVEESDKQEISAEFETPSCREGQQVLETAAGPICIHGETSQPIIDESLNCPDSQTPVVTPAGTFCKLRSLILTSLTEADEQTCAEEHKVLETEAGPICIHNITLQPIVDERVSCTDGQAPVVTPNGTLCMLRSAILQELPRIEGPVCEGHQLMETEAGAVCFHNLTMQPMINPDSVCPDGQISVLTPTGACCKLQSAVLSILNENGTLATQAPVPTCSEGQRILKTEAGIICIYKDTLRPVVDEGIKCPVNYTPIITPSGSVCTRQSAILTRLSETGALICSEGQDILETEVGPICTQGEMSGPMVDDSLSCPPEEMPIVTPVGTACMPSTIIEGLLQKTSETGSCGIGKRIHETEGGLICVDKETDQPVIDEGMFCPEGQAAVVSPSGTFCMLHAIIYGRLSRIPAKSTYMSMTTPSPTLESCLDGQFVLQTDAGPICVYVETQEAVVDKTVSCPDGLLPVVAPSGTFCLLQTKIFAKLSHISLKSNDSFSEDIVNVTEEEKTCGEGQRVHKQKSLEICVSEETLEPVIDLGITCPKSKIAVLTPTGFVCKSQRSIYGKKKFESEFTKSAVENNVIDEVYKDLNCGYGNKVYETEDGLICIDVETEEPIFDESVTCPDSKVPYVTPSGTVCKLRLRETDTDISRKDRFEEGLSNTCDNGQKMLSVSVGVICVYEDSLKPVIDESVFCPQGKVAVRTPSGTSCRLEERIFVTSTTESAKPSTANTTLPSTTEATTPSSAETSTPSLTVSTMRPIPTCQPGEKLVQRQNQYICEEQSLTTQSTTSEAPTCSEGQIVGESGQGLVCLHRHSLKAVIDEQVECDALDVAVVTPDGTVCMLRTLILEDSVPPTPLPRTVQAPAPTASVPLCPRGLTPVLRNGQFVCRHVIVSKADVESSTVRPEQRERCDVGQKIYLTSVGKICVQELTLEPVVNRSVSCPSGGMAVFTPSGVACKDRRAIYQSLPNPIEAPEVTFPDVDGGCPEGQVAVSHNGQLICRPEDGVNTGDDCPPGYQKVMIEGLSEYPCQYVGFTTDKGSRGAERNNEQNLKCPFGLVLTHSANGPACRYPSATSKTTGPRTGDLPTGADNIPDSNFIPPVVTGGGQPCRGGTNCGGENTRPHGQTVTCPGGVNCGGYQPGVHVPVAPCSQGINCAVPVIRTPVVGSGCFNGIQVTNGQPCASIPGSFPQLGNTPCGSGSNCGTPCLTSNCGGGGVPVAQPRYNGCGSGGNTNGGCGIQPRPSYPFSVTQSCSSGFQPYQRGKIYMCVPLKIHGMCGSNVMLKTLLGTERCNGVHQAVPPRRSITPCVLSNGYPITGKLSSACSPLDGLTPVEGAEGVCRAGEQLFQSARGRTVCLPVSSVSATSAPEVQQEALPTCESFERLVKTDRGYSCQRLLASGCNPECANGGTCENGVCRCPRGLSGSSCQTGKSPS